ncbi:MAG: hypothetical protein KQI62_09125 [Deltaproteobacteria bacterium]|nr:hypothetical protein [Deltaproteobacteria bacterium]
MAHTAHIVGEEFWFKVADAGLDAHQTILLFYLIGPPDARSRAGVRRFLPREALAFMPFAGLEGVEAALTGLQKAGLVMHDPDTHLVYTPIVVQMQPYRGHNAVQSAVSGGLKDFPDSLVLAPALEHLAAAEEAAAAEAREKAEAMRESEKKEKALALVERMDVLARELRARLARISGEENPSGRGSQKTVSPPEGVAEGSRRGSDFLGPIPSPLPIPSPEDPSQKGFPKPVEGRCREGPPERLGDVLAKIRGQGGSG